MTQNVGGEVRSLASPKVMAILNVTPDSFFDGGRFADPTKAAQRTAELRAEGADMIDVGAVSTRPGAEPVNPEEEWNRLDAVLDAVLEAADDVPLSVDTSSAWVARKAVERGCQVVNDVSGGSFDADMLPCVAELGVPYIGMHMLRTPKTMQIAPSYAQGVVPAVLAYLSDLVDRARRHGIQDVTVDPGFGFGKTDPQNFELLARLHELRVLGVPILVGLSRKSMIQRTLACTAETALNGTTALHMMALQHGANLLRVHDVAQAREVVLLYQAASQSIDANRSEATA